MALAQVLGDNMQCANVISMEVSSKLGIKEKLLQLLIAGYGIGQFVLLVSGYGTSLSPCISYGRVRPLPDISSGELGALASWPSILPTHFVLSVGDFGVVLITVVD